MSASLRGADAAAIAARYGVPATAAVVVATRATAVALQFPDAFLADAPAVAAALSAAAAAEAAAATTAAAPAVEGAPAAAPLFYILGDSSHSPCCVDGIAAAHVNADLLVHYGEACLSAAPPLPVAYVFPPPAASVGRPARAVAIVDAAARLLRATTGVLSVVVTADLAAVGGGGARRPGRRCRFCAGRPRGSAGGGPGGGGAGGHPHDGGCSCPRCIGGRDVASGSDDGASGGNGGG